MSIMCTTIKEVNGRYTCIACGKEWSAMCDERDVPLTCDCKESVYYLLPDDVIEQRIILEAARIALGDADIYVTIQDRFNIQDSDLKNLQEKLFNA